jgi:hypothetical protein
VKVVRCNSDAQVQSANAIAVRKFAILNLMLLLLLLLCVYGMCFCWMYHAESGSCCPCTAFACLQADAPVEQLPYPHPAGSGLRKLAPEQDIHDVSGPPACQEACAVQHSRPLFSGHVCNSSCAGLCLSYGWSLHTGARAP